MTKNIFQNAEYSKLLFGQLIAHFSDAFIQITLIAWIIQHYSIAGKLVATVFFFFLLPQLLFSPFFGNLADKFSRKILLVLSNIYRCLVVMTIYIFVKSILFTTTSFIIVISFAFLLGSGYSLFYAAKTPIITNIVESSDLKIANSINSGSINFINIFGAAVAAFSIIHFGINKSLLLAACLYLLAAIIFLFIKPKIPQKFNRDEKILVINSKQSLKYIFSHKIIAQFLLLSIVISFVLGIFTNALNTLVIDYFNLGLKGITIVRIMHGIGILLGMLITFFVIKRIKLSSLSKLGFLILFLFLLTFSFCKNIELISLWLLPIGIASIVVYVVIDLGLQKSVVDKMRGSVFGMQLALNTFAFMIGTAFIMSMKITPIEIISCISNVAGITLLMLVFKPSYYTKRRLNG